MAEEIEGQDTGAEAVAGGVDPVAVALALRGASREKADAFLEEQRTLAANQSALIADQRHHLHEQFKHLHLSVWEKRLGVLLRLATAVVGIAVASGFALMVWDAAHSAGLIIEPFAVPPEMAARGLSGQVVASRMLDKLSALQDSTDSSRAPQSYVNNWGDNIKVEIPETGVSIGEFRTFLREWLGHDTHISGEVYRTATGIAVTARVGAEAGTTVTGAETDLDALIQQAADNVYSRTQPYRYANHLDRNPDPVGLEDRRARAATIYEQLIASDDQIERAWAVNGLGSQAAARNQDTRTAIAYYRKSTAIWPDFSVGYFAEGFQQRFLDNREDELAAFRNAARLNHGRAPEIHPKLLETERMATDGQIAMLLGDFGEAARLAKAVVDQHVIFANQNYHASENYAMWALACQHDPSGMRAYERELGHPVNVNLFTPLIYVALEDWRGAFALEATNRKELLARIYTGRTPVALGPLALARAHLGDIKGAEAVIARSPGDCDGCLLAHGQIAEMQGQHTRADWWFARDAARTPSIPFADYEWGRALLERGKADAAIAKFELANQKGPHFADPLEGWGEALMAKNQSHLALTKFEEADKYAPNWGRLHLKWGEALVYTGHSDEAKVQFARATHLDLTPSEKSELERHP